VLFVSEMPQIPEKQFYKASEVCQYTDTQPYVLRFWESEFPQLAPDRGRGGQSVYTRADIDLVLRIKQLLYEDECTLDAARKCLADEQKKRGRVKAQPAVSSAAAAAAKAPARPTAAPTEGGLPAQGPSRTARPASPQRQPAIEFDTVPRERYEGAVEEIAHLRMSLREAEGKSRKMEVQLDKARRSAEDYRGRCEKAIARLEKLLKRLQ